MNESQPNSQYQPRHVQKEKRARKKEGHRLRLEAEREAAVKRKRKRTAMGWGITVVVLLGAGALWYFLLRDDGTTEVVTETTTTATTTAIDTTTTDPNATTTTIVPPVTIPANYTSYAEADYGTTPCPGPDAEQTLSFDDSFQNCLEPSKRYTARFVTSAGDVLVLLDTDNTPGTANNLVGLARSGYYDNTLLHRTDPSIGIIQGGSPHTNSAADPGPGYNIKDEGTEFTYIPGELVMARGGEANSSSAQFFFAVNSSTALLDGQGTYVVFGQTVAGLDVLESILASHQDDPSSQLGGAPNPPVTLETIEIIVEDPIAETTATTEPPAPTTANYTSYTADDYGSTPCPGPDAEQTLDFDDSFQNCLEPDTQYTAKFITSVGDVTVALDTENTPGTANNLIALARYGYYDNTLLHRTAPTIGIVQGGSPHTNTASDPGPGYNIKDEGTEFTYQPGQLAMARTPTPNGASAQFFFAVNSDSSNLDFVSNPTANTPDGLGTYVVFGQTTDGLDVLEAILATHQDGAPDPEVTLETVEIIATPANSN